MVSPGSNALAVLNVALQHDRAASFDHASKLALRQTCTALKAAVNETLTKVDLFRRPSAPLQTFLRRGWPETVAVLRLRWSQLDGHNVLSLPRLQVLHVNSDCLDDEEWDWRRAHAPPDLLQAVTSVADTCPNLRLLWLEGLDAYNGLQTLCTKRWVALKNLHVVLLHFIDGAVPAMEGVDWDSSFPSLEELDVKIGIRKDLPMGEDNSWCPRSLFSAKLPSLSYFAWGDYVSCNAERAHVGDAFLEELATAPWFQRLTWLELHNIEAENVTPLIEAINASFQLERLDLEVGAPRCSVQLTCPSLEDLCLNGGLGNEGEFSFFENAKLPNLEGLVLYSGALATVTPTALPKLKALDVNSCLWEDQWFALGYMVPQLTSLVLRLDFDGDAGDEETFGIEEEDVEDFLQGLRERCSQLFPGSSEQQPTLLLERLEIEHAPISTEAMRLLCSHFLTKCNALRELDLSAIGDAIDCIAAAEQGQTWPCLEHLDVPVFTAEEAQLLGSKAHHWKVHTLKARIDTSNGHENAVKSILADAFSGVISSCLGSIVPTVCCKFVCCPKMQ